MDRSEHLYREKSEPNGLVGCGRALMTKPKAIALTSFMSCFLLLVCVALALASGFVSRPHRFEFPDRYIGWVTIHYRNSSCPPLETDGICIVMSIDNSGFACTSDSVARGIRYTRYAYVRDNGSKISIPGSKRGGSGVYVWEIGYAELEHVKCMFVGTEMQLNAEWPNAPTPC